MRPENLHSLLWVNQLYLNAESTSASKVVGENYSPHSSKSLPVNRKEHSSPVEIFNIYLVYHSLTIINLSISLSYLLVLVQPPSSPLQYQQNTHSSTLPTSTTAKSNENPSTTNKTSNSTIQNVLNNTQTKQYPSLPPHYSSARHQFRHAIECCSYTFASRWLHPPSTKCCCAWF